MEVVAIYSHAHLRTKDILSSCYCPHCWDVRDCVDSQHAHCLHSHVCGWICSYHSVAFLVLPVDYTVQSTTDSHVILTMYCIAHKTLPLHYCNHMIDCSVQSGLEIVQLGLVIVQSGLEIMKLCYVLLYMILTMIPFNLCEHNTKSVKVCHWNPCLI